MGVDQAVVTRHRHVTVSPPPATRNPWDHGGRHRAIHTVPIARWPCVHHDRPPDDTTCAGPTGIDTRRRRPMYDANAMLRRTRACTRIYARRALRGVRTTVQY